MTDQIRDNDISNAIIMSSQKWVYGFTQVDNGVIEHDDLNIYDKMVYIAILSMINQKDHITFPSYETIARVAGCSRRKAIDTVKRLKVFDLIQDMGQHAQWGTNVYQIKRVQESSVLADPDKNDAFVEKEIGKQKPPKKPADPGKDEKDDLIPYKEIIDHLNEKAGKKFVHTADKHRKEIKARYNELKKAGIDHDVIISEFKRTIDVMVNNWTGKTFNGTPAEKYLQPSTLFGKKFDQYRNEEMEIRTPGQVGQAPAQDDWKKRFLEGDDE